MSKSKKEERAKESKDEKCSTCHTPYVAHFGRLVSKEAVWDKDEISLQFVRIILSITTLRLTSIFHAEVIQRKDYIIFKPQYYI